METELETTETEGSEIAEEEPEGSEEEYEEPEEEVAESEESEEEADYFTTELQRLGMTPEGLVKSYAHSQKKITEQGQELSGMRDLLKEMAQRTPGQKEEPKKEYDAAEDFEKLMANPRDFNREQILEIMEARERQTDEYNLTVDSAMAAAEASLDADPHYADMPPEAVAEAERLMDDPMVKDAFNSINMQNYSNYGKAGAQQVYTFLLKMVHDAAIGRASKTAIHNASVKAKRSAKSNYLKKSKATGIKPSAKAKPTKKGGNKDFKARLRDIQI